MPLRFGVVKHEGLWSVPRAAAVRIVLLELRWWGVGFEWSPGGWFHSDRGHLRILAGPWHVIVRRA